MEADRHSPGILKKLTYKSLDDLYAAENTNTR